MNKRLFSLLAIIPILFSCTSKPHMNKFEEVAPYVFLTDTYTELDHDFADKFYAKKYDNWGGGGCSAISKDVSGVRLVGRNLDLNISNKPAYIVRAETGLYKTIGLAYSFRDFSNDYLYVKNNGVDDSFKKILPFICDDVLNDQGLHIELNMRHAEFWPNGDDMFACEHTNASAERRVHMFELPRLVGENCANVTEAIAYLNTLDIYSQNKYWNYCFLISDCETSALVEFCLDSMYVLYENELDLYNEFLHDVCHEDFTLNAIGQTNYYLNFTAYVLQNIKTGMGRFETLQDGINSVNSKEDMFHLMDKIAFSNFYLPYDDCKNNHFDPRSEQIGEFKGASYDIIMNPEFEPYIAAAMDLYSAEVRKLSREEKQDLNKYWESSFTEVVDCTNKNIIIRFFENEERIYRIDFDSISHIQSSEI